MHPVLVFCGELSAATSLVAEAHSVQEATGINAAPYGGLILAAWRGQAREARELIEITMREARSRGEGVGVAICEYARAVLCNGLGQYEEALVAAWSACDDREIVVENWGLTELIESATQTGKTDLARDALERLAGKARASGTDWALGIEARARALLSEGDVAEGQFREAIGHLSRARVRAELARAHSLCGEWLRREGRRIERGKTGPSTRCSHVGHGGVHRPSPPGLMATGETVRKRNYETRDDSPLRKPRSPGWLVTA